MANKTFIITHPKLFLKVETEVNGKKVKKLTRMAKGAEVKMDAKSAASLVKQGKLLVKGSEKAVTIAEDIDDEENDSKD